MPRKQHRPEAQNPETTLVMKDLAEEDNVVIVGRASPIILRDMPNVLRVGVVADWWTCVDRVMQRDHLGRRP